MLDWFLIFGWYQYMHKFIYSFKDLSQKKQRLYWLITAHLSANLNCNYYFIA